MHASCVKNIGYEGGVLELEAYGVVLVVPQAAIDRDKSELFRLEIYGEIPKSVLRENEICPTFAFKATPSGLHFKKPVTITLPHCADLEDLQSVKVVLYTIG